METELSSCCVTKKRSRLFCELRLVWNIKSWRQSSQKKAFSERQSLLVGEIENKKGQRLTAIKRRLALFNRGKIRSAGQPNHLSKFPDPFFCLSKNEVGNQPVLSVTMDAQFPCQKGFFKSSHLGSARRQYSFYETSSFSMLFTIHILALRSHS